MCCTCTCTCTVFCACTCTCTVFCTCTCTSTVFCTHIYMHFYSVLRMYMYLHSGLCTCTCNYTGGFAHVQCHALSQCFAHVHVMHLHSIRILNMYMHLHPILNMYTLLHSVRNMYMHLLLPAKTELQSQLKVGAGLPRAEHVSDCPGGSSKSLLLLSLCWLNAAMAVCLTASAATHIHVYVSYVESRRVTHTSGQLW